ncbi:pH-response regulator protein palC [Cryomyces antarcticus]
MPFQFALPTTSALSFPDFLSSYTHPLLPFTATTCRGVLRDALKKHKRLPPQSQASNLPNVLAALHDYTPYLLALDARLEGKTVAGQEIEVVLKKEIEVEWRAALTASIPGREPPRVKLQCLETEISFVLSTIAYTYSLMARSQLHTIYNATIPTSEQRGVAIAAAMRHLLEAHAVHAHLASRAGRSSSPPAVVDISPPVFSALASLTLAEATLITVLKDDPYPAAVAEGRNKDSKDWMFKAPEIPKVRAHLYARLCLAAAEHGNKAQAMLGSSSKVDEALVKYVDDLRRTARGKACRFLAIDAELSGRTGEGIAWLRGAKKEMGILGAGAGEDKEIRGFSKLKQSWAEKREDKRIEKGGDWGSDAGKFEESRIVDMLERKWVKTNDTVNVQLVPPAEPLLASMPSGREYHTPKPYHPPTLDANALARLRAPPDPSDRGLTGGGDDSSDDDEGRSEPIGAFPGTRADYAGGSSYY